MNRISIYLLVLALVVAALAGCKRETTSVTTTDEVPGGPISAAEIINNPTAWIGKTVTVTGDVEEVWTPRAFNMDAGVSVGELLVVGAQPFPKLGDRDFLVNDVATVTGTVRMLVIAEMERELGWDLQPEIETEFTGKPVLLVGEASFRPGTPSAAATTDPIVDQLLVITPVDPAPLVGRRVTFDDVRVLRVAGDRSFWIGPSESQRILAILGPGFEQPPFEEIVDVDKNQVRSFQGVIRAAPAVAEATARMKLKADDAAALEKARIYIDVDTIRLEPKR